MATPIVKKGAQTDYLHPRLLYLLDNFMEMNGSPVEITEGNRHGRVVKGGAVNTKHNTDDDGWVRAIDVSVGPSLKIPYQEAIARLSKRFPSFRVEYHTKGTAAHIHIEAPEPTLTARKYQKAFDDGRITRETPGVLELINRGLLIDKNDPSQSINGRRGVQLQKELDAGLRDPNDPIIQKLAQRGYVKLPSDTQQSTNGPVIGQPDPGLGTGGSAGSDLGSAAQPR